MRLFGRFSLLMTQLLATLEFATLGTAPIFSFSNVKEQFFLGFVRNQQLILSFLINLWLKGQLTALELQEEEARKKLGFRLKFFIFIF